MEQAGGTRLRAGAAAAAAAGLQGGPGAYPGAGPPAPAAPRGMLAAGGVAAPPVSQRAPSMRMRGPGGAPAGNFAAGPMPAAPLPAGPAPAAAMASPPAAGPAWGSPGVSPPAAAPAAAARGAPMDGFAAAPPVLPEGYEPRAVGQKRQIKRTILDANNPRDPSYYSANKWGAAGRANAAYGQPSAAAPSPEAKRAARMAAKHFQSPSAPIPQPPVSVFATLNELENLIRATLGALASFNEDERMILVRQFRKEEKKALERGEYSPPGLLNVAQFRHAFRKLSVRVTEEQACALFIKYGCDTQGLLPYDMFAAKLLSSPARMMAMEPEQKGAYKMGQRDYGFKGKITYRFCRKPVFPPSAWDGTPALRSAKKPKAGLVLEFVYGYDGYHAVAPNLFYTGDGKVVYYTAGLGVVYDPATHTQAFYKGHSNDIRCLAIHPNRFLVATGQMADEDDGPKGNHPTVDIWDTRDVSGQICELHFPSGPGEPSMRYVVAVGFSGCGNRLVVVTGDNRHTVHVFHWKSKTLIHSGPGHNGDPPQVYGVVWNTHVREMDAKGNAVVPPTQFVTYGCKHLRIWNLGRDQRTNTEIYSSSAGKFGKAQVQDVCSACFINAEVLVTGTRTGELLQWDISGKRGNAGGVIAVIPAHGPGVKVPSIHNGTPTLYGVCALTLRHGVELCSGGADGAVYVWDIGGGTVGRVVKKMELLGAGEATPPAFRSLDARPGSYDLIAGTTRCEIWELSRDIPEPLVQGHPEDVYGIAWHPKKPHRFATACDNANVMLWNARRRQLIAKVNIGVMARSVAFSPNGAHLAVGTVPGILKVLLTEALTTKVTEAHFHKEAIDDLKYSPDGSKLATASHDNFIDVYDVNRGYTRICRCSGHSSYVTHLDWSLDSRVIQSTCGAYELLYFDAANGKQVYQNQRDTMWDTWTVTLGFPVMGVWPKYSDGTDINALCRSNRSDVFKDQDPLVGEGDYVATAGDDGMVNLFNYPCVIEHAPCRPYLGHSSHVMNIRFSPHNRWLLSVGGEDKSAFQWRVVPVAQDDMTVDKPLFEDYQVYEPPKRPAQDIGDVPRLPVGPVVDPAAEDARRKAELEAKKREGMSLYEITVVTSDVRGASCNSRVFCHITGDKANSGEVVLENGPGNFEKGRTDVFKVEVKELGNLQRMVIGQDGKGTNPRWHLDYVIVANKTTNTPPVKFPCGRWFAIDLDDNQLTRILHPQGSQSAVGTLVPRHYKVVVRTSDMRGAGTDANVTLVLYGEAPDGSKRNSGEKKLDNSHNNFERGAVDIFEIEAMIGDLKYIKIGHDNSGPAPSWHLAGVDISSPGTPDLQFVANRWLATDEADGQTYVVLYPTGQGAPPQHKYEITVHTSDIRGAGTDANVTLIMFGSNGLDTGKIRLDNSKNNFERGAIDIFHHEFPDLGDITEVEIEHDNSGPSPGWHCEQVIVEDKTSNKRFAFFCDRWLATDEDDRQIRRRLKAMIPGDVTNYRVTTYTSDIRGAGTDANVTIQLCGVSKDPLLAAKENWGPRHKLDNSTNNFERSQVDTFLLKKQKCLGKLTKLTIGHDNSGMGPGWHLDHVEVVDDAEGVTYYFPCEKWFDKSEGDGLIVRTLEAAVFDPNSVKAVYKITVHTSDIRFGGTDANVHIQLMGERDGQPTNSGKAKLNSSKNDFERAAVDTFTLTLPNIGVLKRIIIGHDNHGAGAAWHLKMVEVLCTNTGQKCSFYWNNWLATDEPPYKTEVELFPEDSDKPLLSRYTVTVHTSDIRGAGTDANVSCMIMGDQGNTPLCKLENSKNNFERGQVDEFIVESSNVGNILKLQIGHDNSGLGPAWHLEHVEVLHQALGERYYFVADQWLDKEHGTLMITLEPSNAAGAKQRWKVAVQTGDERGAGTDADISVILFGDKAQSAELKLESSANNFERNQLDNFMLDLAHVDVGDVQKIEIGFATHQTAAGKAGGIFGQAWHLMSVELVHLNTNKRTFFMWDDWLNDKRRRVQLVPGKIGGNNTYVVVVRTSDIRGAGTDANVTLVITGTLENQTQDSGPHKLDNSTNNFERAAVDRFTIKSKDVGELTRITVTSDGSGFGSAWHLDQVEITDTVRGVTVVFPCGEWLDPSKPETLCQTLLPRGVSGVKGSLLTYEVVVYTGDCRGAGTDSNVSIELHGAIGEKEEHTAPIKLDNSANNFERGMRDVFAPKAIDVGELKKIVIHKDNSGMGADWFLDSVEVFHPLLKKRYNFACNDWLKGAVKKELLVGQAGADGRCRYRITVYTSDIRGAGTDANVTMVLTGEKGDTGERKLDSSANDFERGKVDVFQFDAPDVGRFRLLRIGHDDSGLGSAWHLQKVEINNLTTSEQAVFPCNKWLEKKTALFVELTPDRDGDGIGDALEGGAMTEYTVTVYTSDLKGAGTDANVFLEMYGNRGATGERRLDTSANNFERNMKDVFKFKAIDIGELEKLVIRHDNSGMGSDWHLAQVEVFSASLARSFFFPCNAWLKKEGDSMAGCRKELLVGKPDQLGPTTYRVTVVTSDMRGAGTDADVYIVIYGEKGDTGERLLDNPGKNNFERGTSDVFLLTSPNVGMMSRIKIRSTGSGLGAPWHLARVEVTSSATGETLTFPFGKWIEKKTGLEHVIWPDRDGDGVGDVGPEGALIKYKVFVYTSDVRGAGTDANVDMEIHGDKGFVGATRLETSANNFERGMKDEFEVTGTDVGEVQKIVIGHDNSGLGSSWHLSQVEVWHPVLGKMYVFPCNDWLQYTKEKGVDGCKRELFTGAAAAALGQGVTYRVIVKTSDVRGAGTDADVFLTIYGPKGDTGERVLDNSANNFERNMTDTFIIQGPDVGEPDRIRVRTDGGGLGAAWHLQQMDIFSSATNQSYHFPFANWFDSKNSLSHEIWRDGVVGAGAPLVDYRIMVYTSDVRGAGTDSNVFIELHGALGDVGQTRLETSANNFERGQLDTFVVKGTDVGDVQRIVIWHDDSGLGSDWHLQQVDVFNPSTQRTYNFACNDWLRKTKEKGIAGCKKELLAGAGADTVGGVQLNSYKVEVKTSDMRGAGTDANVTIQVFGKLGDTGVQNLESSANDFERNKLDNFFFKAPDIGEIQSAKVVCDNSGLGAAWHLDYVTLTNATTAEHAKFLFKTWFDDKEGWTHTRFPEGKVPDTRMMVDYQVTIITSDIRGAGTDGEVFLTMKGDKGAMGEQKMPSKRGSFERSSVDVFDITGSDIGHLKELTVRLEEHGVGAAWHFREIEVLNKKTGSKARFVFNDWLEKGEKHPNGSVTLHEATSEEAKAANPKVQWRVTTQTSNIFGAGTDANVFIKIVGPTGMLGGAEIFLDNSKNNFERGQLDVFFVDFPRERDCGTPIQKIIVERQASALLGADWHLDWIEVTDIERAHTYKWRCGHWFSTKEGLVKEWSFEAMASGTLQQLTLVEAPGFGGPDAPQTSGSQFRILIVTSDKFGAGTDATVRCEFKDVTGNVWAPALPHDKTKYQRGCRAEHVGTSLVPMQEIASCRVYMEGGGLGDNWHLDHVLLTHLPSLRAWRFVLNNWVHPKDGALMQATLVNNVPLDGPYPEDPNAPDVAPRSDQMQPLPPIEYQVIVTTGDKYGAGTDSIITMEVTGSFGKATHTFDQAKALFERNSSDRFVVRIPDCGDLASLRLWHDGSGFGADWFVARVTLEALPYSCKWAANLNVWVKGGEDKAAMAPLTLESGTPPSQQPAAVQQVHALSAAQVQQRLANMSADRSALAALKQQVEAGPQPPSGPPRPQVKPGDPGVSPYVLQPNDFFLQPAMQAGDPRKRLSRDVGAAPEPKCDWQAYTVPYAQDPRFMVTYYHNRTTGQSQYDKPAEYAQWEAQQRAWLAALVAQPG